MATYELYTKAYLGDSIPKEEFPRLAARAEAQLARYERLYRVEGEQTAKDNAVCAMADALYYFETAQSTPQSSSIGSVSSSQGTADVSPKVQAAELYRCACLYLGIYRGCRPC